MNEGDLRAVADAYGEMAQARDRLRAQRRPNAVLNVLAETVRFSVGLANVPEAFLRELRFEYSNDGLSAQLHWLGTALRLVVHEEPHWISPDDYDLDVLYEDFACTRLVAWQPAGETERVAGEILFFDHGDVHLTGCFSDQHAEVLTEYHQVVDEMFEWMVKKFRPRVERKFEREY